MATTKSMNRARNVEESAEAKITFNNDDLISCRSLVSGPLYIEGVRTKILYSWADYGDVVDIEYQDLIYMVRSRGDKNIYDPRIVIEDEEFVNQNSSLKQLYESLYSMKDLKDIINLSTNKMIEEINKLPEGAKTALKGLASTMIDAGTLDSVQKIKALDEVFGTQMFLTLQE